MEYIQLELNFALPFKAGDVVQIKGTDSLNVMDWSNNLGVIDGLGSDGYWWVSFPDIIAPYGLPWLLRFEQSQLTKTGKKRLPSWARK